jgi:hypothetical protein
MKCYDPMSQEEVVGVVAKNWKGRVGRETMNFNERQAIGSII